MDIVLDLRNGRHEPHPQVHGPLVLHPAVAPVSCFSSVALHQAHALMAAQRVAHAFTRAGKVQAKRECLAHLRASLLSTKEGAHVET